MQEGVRGGLPPREEAKDHERHRTFHEAPLAPGLRTRDAVLRAFEKRPVLGRRLWRQADDKVPRVRERPEEDVAGLASSCYFRETATRESRFGLTLMPTPDETADLKIRRALNMVKEAQERLESAAEELDAVAGFIVGWEEIMEMAQRSLELWHKVNKRYLDDQGNWNLYVPSGK